MKEYGLSKRRSTEEPKTEVTQEINKGTKDYSTLDLTDAKKIIKFCITPRKTSEIRSSYDHWKRNSGVLILGGFSFDDYIRNLEKEGFLISENGMWHSTHEALDYIEKYHGY